MKIQTKMRMSSPMAPYEESTDDELFALSMLMDSVSYLYDENKEAYEAMIKPGEGIQSRQVVAVLHALVKLGLVELS